jgi:DNA-binding NtrC family response regulator
MIMPFHILVVEDDVEFHDDVIELLKADAAYLAGAGQLKVYLAENQAEADRAIMEAPPGGFDLILLDRQYPQQKGDKPEFLGDTWLPKLRELQPNAAIVILTNFAGLLEAVEMVRDYYADEFIQKNDKWELILTVRSF